MSDRASFRVAHPKNAKYDVVAARKNVGAQNVQRNNGERSGNLCQQPFTLPRAESDDAVSLLWHNLPFDRCSQRRFSRVGNILEKRSEQFQVLDNLRHISRAKIVIWHELKVRFDFVCVVRRKILGYGALQAFALDFCLVIVRLLVGQIARRLMKQFPNEGLLPIRPRFGTCALTISQSKQH